jgi:hypothetical protein
VVTGARQTGKTTLLRYLFPEHHYVSLDAPAEAALADDAPAAFLARHLDPVLIDEVQYAPRLFRHLKLAIDARREANGRFVVTGSQKFSLMKEVADSLAGRCAVLELEGLSVAELGDVFHEEVRRHGFGDVLARGFMPQLWKDLSLRPADFWSSYQATYLERDVRQILNVGSRRDFDRFMRLAAARSGQLLNKTDLARDVGVSAKTIADWLSVMTASNQISLLEPYFANVGKRLVKSPKLYFNDVGLLCFLLGLSAGSVSTSALIGPIWETFVYGELRKFLRLEAPEARVYFYRDQSREVDFVVERGGSLTLAEAKWKEIPVAADFQPAVAVRTQLPRVRSPVLVLCRSSVTFPVAEGLLAVDASRLRAHI